MAPKSIPEEFLGQCQLNKNGELKVAFEDLENTKNENSELKENINLEENECIRKLRV